MVFLKVYHILKTTELVIATVELWLFRVFFLLYSERFLSFYLLNISHLEFNL